METKLTITCDIKHAQEILYAASKIIQTPDAEREAVKQIPEVRCPNCHWQGMVKDLRVGAAFEISCPNCSGFISRYDYGLSVYEFMQLENHEMVKYVCVECDGNEWDIGIFTTRYDLSCETCGDEAKNNHTFLIGTSDSRDAKFCFPHYTSLNKESRFIKKGVQELCQTAHKPNTKNKS